MSEQSAMRKRARIAGPDRSPTFDADASVAAAVLSHVTCANESDFDYESDFDLPPPEEPPFQIIIRDLRNRQDAD
jgi:hypothetical protein